jgi:hypothetical protein
LSLRRSGQALQFLAGPSAANLHEIGTAAYGGGPIEKVMFRVVVPETTSRAEVAWEKIVVEAERIKDVPKRAASIFGRRAWVFVGVLVVIALTALFLWRFLGRPRRRQSAGPVR